VRREAGGEGFDFSALITGGWAAYFRFGNSAARFCKIRNNARMRPALFISKRHHRSRGVGWSVVTYHRMHSMRRGLETEQTWPRSLGWRN
jgi:hypothetical protein